MASRYYVPLPEYQVPRNAILDVSGISKAIDQNREDARQNKILEVKENAQKLDQQRFGLQQRADAREGEMHGFRVEQAGLDAQRELAKHFATVAQFIIDEPDPARQKAMFGRVLDRDPRIREATSRYFTAGDLNDPIAVSKWWIAQAEGLTPHERQMRNLDLQGKQIAVATARREYEQPKDALQKLKDDETLYRINPRTGRYERIAGGYADGTRPGGPFKDAKQLADVEEGLRKEFSSHAKPYFEVRDAYSRVNQARANPSPAGDISLIFAYMRMLDPTSTVREGEFATAQNATGVPDRVVNFYNRVLSGERLSDAQRSDFLKQAQGLWERQEKQYVGVQRQYEALARRKGIDPRNVFIDYGVPSDTTPPDPLFGSRSAGVRNGPVAGPRVEKRFTDRLPQPDQNPQAQGMIPPRAIQDLRANPHLAPEFERKYGPGSARQFLMDR